MNEKDKKNLIKILEHANEIINETRVIRDANEFRNNNEKDIPKLIREIEKVI